VLAAGARGVAVSVVGPGPADDAPAAFGRLAAAGAVVRAQAAPSIHAKALVADARSVYVGSVNLTSTSLDRNRELGLALDDAAIAAELGSTIAADAVRGIAPPP
jgi:cardiolipin synthase